jgi:hypothetical protein
MGATVNPEDLARALLAAAAGTFIGWAGSALTIGGRVSAIENTLARIESRIDSYVVQRTEQTPDKPAQVKP